MLFYFYYRSKLSLFQSRISLQKASVKVSFEQCILHVRSLWAYKQSFDSNKSKGGLLLCWKTTLMPITQARTFLTICGFSTQLLTLWAQLSFQDCFKDRFLILTCFYISLSLFPISGIQYKDFQKVLAQNLFVSDITLSSPFGGNVFIWAFELWNSC